MLLGMTVEDSIYLSILGVGGGRLGRSSLPRKDRRFAIGHARPRGASRSITSWTSSSGSLSHGEHRQVAIAMALASEPTILMLDEPASGLSRGERQLLTELLLALDREITLILIEHDMDVALASPSR